MPSTIRLHRIFRAPPERVYRAFLDPDAIVKWNPPNGFTCKVHALVARVGGAHLMSFTNFTKARATPLVGNILNWRQMKAFAQRTRLTIQISLA